MRVSYMKLLHLSDLHLGKRLNEFSLIEDQRYILKQTLDILDKEHPNGLIIAGDVYDKSMPSEEAVHLMNWFLSELVKRQLKTFIISGNHDSAERLSFGNEILKNSDVYISPVYQGETSCLSFEDEYGPVHIHLLPFIKPTHVKRHFPQEKIETYTDAVSIVVKNMNINVKERNILVTHQFVTGASAAGSEELFIGGSESVDASCFDAFDYVALGHIHGPQKVIKETIRYCGTLLQYSFSEVNHQKSITLVELREKGNVQIRTIPVIPLRQLRIIKGSYDELCLKSNYENTNTEDYVQVVLTDEEDIIDAVSRLRTIYPNIMQLKYDNTRTRQNMELEAVDIMKTTNPLELFNEFYELQNNQPMSNEQSEYMTELIHEIWGNEK